MSGEEECMWLTPYLRDTQPEVEIETAQCIIICIYKLALFTYSHINQNSRTALPYSYSVGIVLVMKN